jgi:hypothetical protein
MTILTARPGGRSPTMNQLNHRTASNIHSAMTMPAQAMTVVQSTRFREEPSRDWRRKNASIFFIDCPPCQDRLSSAQAAFVNSS